MTIQGNINWGPHISNICAKANRTRGFLQRNLRKSPPKLKNQAYKTYVRPTLEYASTVWAPHTDKDINRLEMVQRRAARFVKADFHSRHSVTKMLHQLDWQTLNERRAQAKVTMLYRIIHCLVAIPAAPYLTPSPNRIRRHTMQFLQHPCRINAYQYSFFPSAIPLWNNLPSDGHLGPLPGLIPGPSDTPNSCLNKTCFSCTIALNSHAVTCMSAICIYSTVTTT